MKDAQTMLRLAKEAQANILQANAINTMAFDIGKKIEARAEEGDTTIKVSMSDMPFDVNFMLTLTNVQILIKHIQQFGYDVSLLLNEETHDMILHISWDRSLISELYETLRSF